MSAETGQESDVPEPTRDTTIARLFELFIQDEIDSLDGPHIVICRSTGSSFAYFSGPYESGLAAIWAAHEEAQGLTPEDNMEFDIAPLGPPLEWSAASPPRPQDSEAERTHERRAG